MYTHDMTFYNLLAIEEKEQPTEVKGSISHTLKLPGKRLYLTPLLKPKKFRNHGYKAGALAIFDELQQAGLGVVETITKKSGVVGYVCTLANNTLWNNSSLQQQHVFTKVDVPTDDSERGAFAKKLMRYGVSILDYAHALKQPEIRYVILPTL